MSCNSRSPNNARIIQTMDIETLLAYAKIHISMDSQDLIDTLVAQLEVRIKTEFKEELS